MYDIKGWDPCEIDEWVTTDGSTTNAANNDKGLLKRKLTTWGMHIGIDRLIYNKNDVLLMKNAGSTSIFPHVHFKLPRTSNDKIDYISCSWSQFIFTVDPRIKLLYSLNLLHNDYFARNNCFAFTLNKCNYNNYSNVNNDLQCRLLFIRRSYNYRSDKKLGIITITENNTKVVNKGFIDEIYVHNKIEPDRGTLNDVIKNPYGFITSYMIGYTNDSSTYANNFRTRMTALTLTRDRYIEKIWGGGEYNS